MLNTSSFSWYDWRLLEYVKFFLIRLTIVGIRQVFLDTIDDCWNTPSFSWNDWWLFEYVKFFLIRLMIVWIRQVFLNTIDDCFNTSSFSWLFESVNSLLTWDILSPGSIVHYGSAGLKQSDHRPVLASIEVEGRTVREDAVNAVYREVVSSLGPSDCTVLVQVSAPLTLYGENYFFRFFFGT